jgi:O-Antigen ligase
MNSGDKLQVRGTAAQLSVGLLLCLSITAPAVNLSSSLPYFKVEQLLVPVVALAYLWLLLAGVARTIRSNGMFLIGFLFCLCNAISIWYGGAFLGHTVIVRDYYELPKVLLPVAFFTIAYEAGLTEAALKRLIAIFSVAILAVCSYAWAQFAGLGFTYKLNSYYSGGGHIDQALQYAGRVYATMGNANVLGQLMTWCTLLFVLAALFGVGNRFRNLSVAFACVVTLVMTGSRYGLLTLSIGFVLLIALLSFAGRRQLLQLVILLLLLPTFAWTYQTVANTNRQTLQRYLTLRNPLQIDSLRQRLDDVWRQEWKDFSESPVFGHGPAKSFYTAGFSDSEYLGVLREKGLLGLFVFLGYYFYPLFLLGAGERIALHRDSAIAVHTPANLAVLHAALLMGVLALVMNIGMATFYSPFLQGFLWLWLGLGARSAMSIRASQSQNVAPGDCEVFEQDFREQVPTA